MQRRRVRRWRVLGVGLTALVLAACGSSGGSGRGSSTTSRPSGSSTSHPSSSTTTTTDPAAPGEVAVDLRSAVTQPDTAPDGVPATFTYGSGPDQLGYVPGQQAAPELPSGFVLTHGTAWILDNVNRRFVPVRVPSGARPGPLAAPDLVEGIAALGPDDVVYLATGWHEASGLNAYALTGTRAGQRLAGPTGLTSPGALQGTPVVFGPDTVTDEAGSVHPMPYVTSTGAPLPHPTITPVPTAEAAGGAARVTYRTSADAPLRTWIVTPPTTRATMPIAALALPDATVVVMYYLEQNGGVRWVLAHLTSKGVARTVVTTLELVGDARAVHADASGVYLFGAAPGGFQLVRYAMT